MNFLVLCSEYLFTHIYQLAKLAILLHDVYFRGDDPPWYVRAFLRRILWA